MESPKRYDGNAISSNKFQFFFTNGHSILLAQQWRKHACQFSAMCFGKTGSLEPDEQRAIEILEKCSISANKTIVRIVVLKVRYNHIVFI